MVLVLDLAHCFKKRILVGSGYGSYGRAPRAAWWLLCYASETPVAHKQFRVDQARVPEAQQISVEGPGMQIASTALVLVVSYANGLG